MCVFVSAQASCGIIEKSPIQTHTHSFHIHTHTHTHREAVLDTILAENLQAHALEVGTYLKNQLHLLQARHSEVIGNVRGLGLFLGVELVDNPHTRTPSERAATWVARRCLEMDVQISTDGPQHNVLKIKPPLCFGKAEADELVRVLDVALTEWDLSLYQEVV